MGSPWGQRHWQRPFLELLLLGEHWQAPLRSLAHPTACRDQCWDTLGKVTNRTRTQPHLSADRHPNLPENTVTSRPALPFTHQWAGTSQSVQESAPGSGHASPTRGQTLDAREPQSAEPACPQQARPYPGTSWPWPSLLAGQHSLRMHLTP